MRILLPNEPPLLHRELNGLRPAWPPARAAHCLPAGPDTPALGRPQPDAIAENLPVGRYRAQSDAGAQM